MLHDSAYLPQPFWRVTVPFRYSASWLPHACLRRAAGFRSRLHHNEIKIIVKHQRLCLILKWFFLSKAKFKRVLTFLLLLFLNGKLLFSPSFCELSWTDQIRSDPDIKQCSGSDSGSPNPQAGKLFLSVSSFLMHKLLLGTIKEHWAPITPVQRGLAPGRSVASVRQFKQIFSG